MSETLTKAELARRLGIGRSRVTALVKRGLPVRADGRIDLADALTWLKANGERQIGFPDRGVSKVLDADNSVPADGAALPYAEARALRETYQARLARLDYEAKAGRLLAAEVVEREWAAILGGVRARMLAVASRCGGRLPHLTAHDIAEIDREVRAALSELGGDDANSLKPAPAPCGRSFRRRSCA